MKRIVINESHIRQLVKETLENLILGEDDIDNDFSTLQNLTLENVFNILSNSEDAWVNDYELNEFDATINIIGEFKRNENDEDITSYYITAYADIDGYNEKFDEIDFVIKSFDFEIDENNSNIHNFILPNENLEKRFIRSLVNGCGSEICKIFSGRGNVERYVEKYPPYGSPDYDRSDEIYDTWKDDQRQNYK